MIIWVALTVIGVAGTLAAERHKRPVLRAVLKVVASVGFMCAAVASGALQTRYGQVILIGLALSWFGDVFLLSRARGLFLAGLVSFLLAHVAYVTAFAVHGLDLWACLGALVGVVVVGGAILTWMFPSVPSDMRGPVVAYIVVISVMVMLSAGAVGAGGHFTMLLGGAAFYVSDVFVARDRFVAPGFSNALCGLPIYYGAQLLLAYTVSQVL